MRCVMHKGKPLPNSLGQLDNLADGNGASLIPEREPPKLGDVLKFFHTDGLFDLDSHNGNGVALDELDLQSSLTAQRLFDRLHLFTRKALLVMSSGTAFLHLFTGKLAGACRIPAGGG